ncbi:chromate transporter [Caproicibacter sp.]|uniref:chromate transporter n=1 Tax=Caproicibacter sp. TaxID=2814884 RepID=UPI00398A000C
MNKGWKFYWKLFSSTFYLSAFTFGGGYVIVPLMQKKFVDEYKWIEEKEMLDLVAIAQSTPGAIAVNASILIGYRLAGLPGTFITILGTVLPPLVILSVISLFYVSFQKSTIVKYVLRGMSAGVAAVIADVTVKMGKDIFREKSIFTASIMIVSFLAVTIFDVDVKLIILVCGLLGLANGLFHKLSKKEMS